MEKDFTYKIHTSLINNDINPDLLLYYFICKEPIIEQYYMIYIKNIQLVEIKYLSCFIQYIFYFTALCILIQDDTLLNYCIYKSPISFQNMSGHHYTWLNINIFTENTQIQKANFYLHTIIYLLNNIRCYGNLEKK